MSLFRLAKLTYILWLSFCNLGHLYADYVDATTPIDILPPGFKLVFSDEFNGKTIDHSKWNLGINERNIQNIGVDCVYCWKNVSLRNGWLVLQQIYESKPINGAVWGDKEGIDFNYSSGGLNTEGIFYLENNMYVEICLRLPSNSGGYVAFWGMSNKKDLIIENKVELDFFEFIASKKRRRLWSGLWWHDFLSTEVADYVPTTDRLIVSPNHIFVKNQKHKANIKKDINDIEHEKLIKFGFLVTENKMNWFICNDGSPLENKPYLMFNGGLVESPSFSRWKSKHDEWVRDVPNPLKSTLIINYAMRGATWAGGPIDHDQLPAEMLVDYIRVYQFNNLFGVGVE
ncbi:MAG: hypothetical protein ACJZ86_02855 [Pontiellaceae bacterium]